ncbi:MAG: hypothetical protein GTO41_01055, partial [Burkholderiales bacterium]|nr:hypothetical protein [Burkholderiales bacterium]
MLSNLEAAARWVIVMSIQDIRTDDEVPADEATPFEDTLRVTTATASFVKVNKLWIPAGVYELVESNPGAERPTTAEAYYDRYVQLRWLQRRYTIPAFLSVFILVLYFLGKFFAA